MSYVPFMKPNILFAIILALITSSSVFAGKQDQEFLLEVSKGNEARALMILSTGYRFDKETGHRAFELAIEAGSTVLAKRLLERGVEGDVDQALIIAARRGDEPMVDMLLSQNADVNVEGNYKTWGNYGRDGNVKYEKVTATEIAIIRAVSKPFSQPQIAVKLLKQGGIVRHPHNYEVEQAFIQIWREQSREQSPLYDQLVDALPSDFYNTVLSESYVGNYERIYHLPGNIFIIGDPKLPHREARARKIKLRFKRALADVIPLTHENRKAKYAEVTCILEQNGIPRVIQRIVGRYTEALPVLVGENPNLHHTSECSEKKNSN